MCINCTTGVGLYHCINLTFCHKTNVSRACHNKLAVKRYISRCVGLFKVGVHTSDDWPTGPGAHLLRLRRPGASSDAPRRVELGSNLIAKLNLNIVHINLT